MAQFNDPKDSILPEDFDGVFKFTNPDDEEFVGKWGGKAYKYPPMKTISMLIEEASPREVQNIRRKFAKELGEKMFFKSQRGKQMSVSERQNNMPTMNSIFMAGQYSDDDLAPFIQQVLTPLPLGRQTVTEVPKPRLEEKLHTDDEGKILTKPVGKGKSIQDLKKDFGEE